MVITPIVVLGSKFNDLIIMIVHEEELLKLFHPTKGDIVLDIGACLDQ